MRKYDDTHDDSCEDRSGRFVFVAALHTAMYSLAVRWLRKKINARSKQNRMEISECRGRQQLGRNRKEIDKKKSQNIKNNA
jgi:hypothetical protein